MVTRQEIVPPLECGLISTELGSAAGTIFPQPRIVTSDGMRLMDEVSGAGWLLIVDGRKKLDGSAVREPGIAAFAIGGEGHAEIDEVAAAWFDRYRCGAAIVRPDHYVYCTVSELGRVDEIWRGVQSRIGVAGAGAAR